MVDFEDNLQVPGEEPAEQLQREADEIKQLVEAWQTEGVEAEEEVG